MSHETVPIIHHVSDGGMTADHAERAISIVVAPAVADENNTLGLPLATVGCFRIDDPRFHFDSSFLHPDAAEDFAALGALVRGRPDAPLAVFGHADPTGEDAYNKRLAGRRADAVYAVLVRDLDLWEQLYTRPFQGDDWTFQSVQLMLNALGFEHPVDGKPDSPTSKDAVTAFQDAHADELKVDGVCGPRTRGVLFRLYMEFLCTISPGDAFSVTSAAFLGGGGDPKRKCAVQGCGELNPVLMLSQGETTAFREPARKAERDDANAPNRRVVIFLFTEGTVVSPKKWPCPRTEEDASGCMKRLWSDAKARRTPSTERRTFQDDRDTFACRFYHGLAMRSPCERLTGCSTVVLRLIDHLGFPVERRPVRVWVNDEAARPATTGDDGIVQTKMPDGSYAIETLGGQFAYFGDQYPLYQHDPVSEVTEVPALSEDPGSRNDRAEGSLDELADSLEQSFSRLDEGP